MTEKEFQPRIMVFACNWCSYAGADLAGVSRIQYPPTIRIIRVLCSSRVDPSFILKAFLKGADGVLVAGCHLGDCHYIDGNYNTERRIKETMKALEYVGFETKRLRLEWISASEGSKFSKETVLSNHIRNGIYNYIRVHPGVHFSILRKKALPEVKGSSGQLVWHLEMLLKFNYIKKIKVGNYTVFLPIDVDEEVGPILFLLRDKINNKVIQLLFKENTVERSEIYKEVEQKREDVYYRINNLIDQDILIVSASSDKEISINPNVKEIVAEILKTSKLYIEKNKSSREEEV